jgi:hypothetical protein
LAYVLMMLFPIFFFLGLLLLVKITSKAKEDTDKKLGYGPIYGPLVFFRGAFMWPSNYFKNIFVVKEEYKNKIDTWNSEYNNTTIRNRLFFPSIVFIVIGIFCIVSGGYLNISHIKEASNCNTNLYCISDQDCYCFCKLESLLCSNKVDRSCESESSICLNSAVKCIENSCTLVKATPLNP